jgi:hypothetical protein
MDTVGSAINNAVTGNAELPNLGGTALQTTAESATASFSTIDTGISTTKEMHTHMSPATARGNQVIPRALANQRYTKSVLRFNSATSIVASAVIEALLPK